ncbi:MAG: hypothetical protein LBP79_05690 [Clostridiales bacterium]|jgi:hypothetical protein|nr:hypothetical protein [Clostridiales bacterium]
MYFSDIFEIDNEVLSEYGAFNISLINDLPLFIDPFLLFNSESETYKSLHSEIIKYLVFLRDNVTGRNISNGMLDAWFRFPEVKQAWLGFSLVGNSGRGLGRDFAVALSSSLRDIFSQFGNEQITQGTHLEKLCLIKEGVGKDCISDFVANLIKGYLAEYTQKFAADNIDARHCRKCSIDKAVFNYTTKAWEARQYVLPFFSATMYC